MLHLVALVSYPISVKIKTTYEQIGVFKTYYWALFSLSSGFFSLINCDNIQTYENSGASHDLSRTLERARENSFGGHQETLCFFLVSRRLSGSVTGDGFRSLQSAYKQNHKSVFWNPMKVVATGNNSYEPHQHLVVWDPGQKVQNFIIWNGMWPKQSSAELVYTPQHEQVSYRNAV